MQTYYCPACMTTFAPYMCSESACPRCHTGTRRSNEPMSLEADSVFKEEMAKRAAEEQSKRTAAAFEVFLEERQRQEIAAAVEDLIRDSRDTA